MTTQSRLTKGMFGHGFHPAKTLFNLSNGQCRSHDFLSNSSWYNKQGEKLGWGDLAPKDILRISDNLEYDELFIILYKSNILDKDPDAIGNIAGEKFDKNAPGTDYIAKKCCYIIAKHQCYFVDRHNEYLGNKTANIEGLQFTILTPEAAKQIIIS